MDSGSAVGAREPGEFETAANRLSNAISSMDGIEKRLQGLSDRLVGTHPRSARDNPKEDSTGGIAGHIHAQTSDLERRIEAIYAELDTLERL